MIFLAATTDKIRLTTNSAAAIDVVANYGDNASGTLSFAPQVTAITSAGTTDILSAPAASTTRKLKFMSIRNKDASLACTVTVIYQRTGPVNTEMIQQLLNPGDTLEYMEGVGFYLVTANANLDLIKILTADDTGGQAVNTVQPWFPTAGGVTIPAAGTYEMHGLLYLTTGATSHSTGLSFGGTATVSRIDYVSNCQRSAAQTNAAPTRNQINTTSNTTIDAAGTQAATYVEVNGLVTFSASGTFIPQFTFSANPTGTITAKRGSKFVLKYRGDSSFASQGTWA